MSNEIMESKFNAYELALVKGDLKDLSDEERLSYVQNLCNSLGVNMLTRPFDYIVLNGKLTLYANKGLAEQLRSIKRVSIEKIENKIVNDIMIVTAYAKDLSGRSDCATGAVNISGLSGNELANAIMKAETKAKRRVTLSICGLNMLDESELESIKEKKILNHKEDLKVWGEDKKQIADKNNELKKLGAELRTFLKDNGLSEAEQNEFLKSNGIFSIEKIKKALADKENLIKNLIRD